VSVLPRDVGPRRLVLGVAVAYAVALALLVLGPWGWALNRATVQLYVFFRSDLPIAPAGALPEHYGLVLNVLLFVPLGAALVLLTGWSWWSVTLLAAAGSGVIEVVQELWLDRQGSLQDVVANTLGGLLGALAVSLLARARSLPGSRPEPARRR